MGAKRFVYSFKSDIFSLVSHSFNFEVVAKMSTEKFELMAKIERE